MRDRTSGLPLSAEDRAAMKEFWRFYEARRSVVVASVGPAALGEVEAVGLGAAIREGHWAPYLAALRAQGERYAGDGIPYGEWFAPLRAFRAAIRAQVAGEPAAVAVVQGMDCLVDLVDEHIGAAYLDTKDLLTARAEERYRLLFDHSPTPMWTYDRATLRFVMVNEAAIRLYGYTREEFEAMTLADIRPAEDVDALKDDVGRSSGLTDARVWRHRKKDGSLLLVDVSADDFVVDGRAVRLVLVRDVTARVHTEEQLKKTEDQLRHAQKMEAVGRLAGGVAHDFNNMLTVVQGYAGMLEDSLDREDVRREDAAEIRRAAERARGITRQLLTLSRHSIVAPRAIDLDLLVEGFGPILRRLVGESVTISIRRGGVSKVIADAGQLEQVLLNLAVNARDAMPAGGRLTIEAQDVTLTDEHAARRGLPPGRYVELAVTDTGTGMDAEIQRRIFDPFFTTKEVGKGTGLGLSIVHGIVSQAGGAISVYSEPGHGSTFRVHLPVADHDVAAPEPVDLVAPRTLPPLRALVIDDRSDVRAVAARILEDAGCSVVEAATAEEARRICAVRDGMIDLVLLDVVLADGRGDILVGELREMLPRATFLLMSGYPAGALSPSGSPHPLVAKPFSPSELRAAVARACGADVTAAEPRASAEPSRRRVLLADDEVGLRRALARAIALADVDVVEAGTGEAVAAALAADRFDVVVGDVHMPGGGLELVRTVRRADLDVPVILMTGDATPEDAAAAVEYGVFRYLAKPLDVAGLNRAVGQAMRAHALARLRREAHRVTGAHVGVADRAGLEVRFDQALAGLWMAFQPIVHASTGAPFGVEALLRSNEPSFPTPPSLLDAAAQLGRVHEVGRKARGLSAAAHRARTDDVALFVNLHPDDLTDPDLVDRAAPLTALAKRVVLEITERASWGAGAAVVARIAELRRLGFRLAVDDIGAGYSGLAGFAELTPELVKIDLALVRDIHKSAVKQRTVGALCRLCRDTGTLVVGEGVETVEEREALVALGCDLVQGYAIGRPARAP